jgi:hypothetical protein
MSVNVRMLRAVVAGGTLRAVGDFVPLNQLEELPELVTDYRK